MVALVKIARRLLERRDEGSRVASWICHNGRLPMNSNKRRDVECIAIDARLVGALDQIFFCRLCEIAFRARSTLASACGVCGLDAACQISPLSPSQPGHIHARVEFHGGSAHCSPPEASRGQSSLRCTTSCGNPPVASTTRLRAHFLSRPCFAVWRSKLVPLPSC